MMPTWRPRRSNRSTERRKNAVKPRKSAKLAASGAIATIPRSFASGAIEIMPKMKGKPGAGRERREKQEKFQSFNRPKLKVIRTSESGEVYIDYKDTESLRK